MEKSAAVNAILDTALSAMDRGRAVWETSGFGEAAERARRHPHFPPAVIGGLILVSLTICGVTGDETLSRSFRLVTLTIYEHSSAWWAMPSALAALAALALSRRMQETPWKLLASVAALAVFVAVHRRLAERGALPYLALRETSDLFAYFLLALALWRYGKLYPVAAPLVAAAGFMLVILSRLGIEAERSLFRPDLFVLVLSIPLVLSAAWDARQSAMLAAEGGAWAPEIRPGLQFLALLTGGATGSVLQVIDGYRAGAAQVTDALGALWSQSVLAGHGHSVAMRLLRAWTEPQVIDEPRWMGWTGMLATGGVLVVGAIALVSAMLVVREYRGRMEHRAAALAAQLTIGLILIGGPNSLVPMLTLIVWSALALSTPMPQVRERREAADSLRARVGQAALGVSMLVLAVMCLNFRAPLTAPSELGVLALEEAADERLRERLDEIEARLEWHPMPAIIRASWLRTDLTRSPGWNEDLYRSICAEYERAMRLDPYEATIPLKLAEVQSIAERTTAALETAQTGLDRIPGSPDLMTWLYFHARSNNLTPEAGAMIERSLYLEPEAARWWRNRFWFEQAAGRGPSATVALNVALTAAVADPREAQAEIVSTSFERSEGRL